MRTWEYKRLACSDDKISEACNWMGSEGWELAAMAMGQIAMPGSSPLAVNPEIVMAWSLMFKREKASHAQDTGEQSDELSAGIGVS